MGLIDNVKTNLQRYGVLTQIILLNAVVFLTVNIFGNIAHTPALLDKLALPLGSAAAFLSRFWTLFTYMFTHESFWHLFWNMLLFYFLSQLMINMIGTKRLWYVYVMSGLSGGALMVILGLVFPENFSRSILVGASASVLGIGAVMVLIAPDYRVLLWGIIDIPYKLFFLLLFIVTTVIDLSSNTGGKIAHIGGTLYGLVYGLAITGKISLPSFRRKTKLKTVYRNASGPSRSTISDEQRMDILLDKISKSGYESLSKSEKDELFRLSKRK